MLKNKLTELCNGYHAVKDLDKYQEVYNNLLYTAREGRKKYIIMERISDQLAERLKKEGLTVKIFVYRTFRAKWFITEISGW